ncbi:hypothetical protein TIN4_77 [Tsukamurella phage TIN4]|uniref:Uncharacterized protein n=2 Tax=Tinduovirus TIN3 TaxID=1982571 RepID=A0A0K0N653_9CAUD|nr:hypothetical protein AVT54_gp048 [Tsukamurella phage TIN3]YP_009604207.1 hypothetical protein FDH87_gp048 [Tsukamurella phage TIN4]AKJ71874.1 hypothetical protein TIN3_77 [Tsukamurella phage TIN3]AKJ71983.1 hypothetical protein TIN4_77 [Tsukamurella phage TIN4]
MSRSIKVTREVNKAIKQGYDPYIATELYVKMNATGAPRGFVRYYILQHGWTCDECGDRVTVGGFVGHVRRKHGAM